MYVIVYIYIHSSISIWFFFFLIHIVVILIHNLHYSFKVTLVALLSQTSPAFKLSLVGTI